jgi:hypothetical protein
MPNVVLNISELLFETPDLGGDTTTLPVADIQLFPNYGNNTFFFIGFSGYSKSLHMGEGPLAYNRPLSWDDVPTTWCTHCIRKPLGS